MVQSAERSPSDPIENPVWTFGDFLLITLGFAGFLLVAAYVTSLFGIFVAPLCEEIYFRGLMYPVLVRAFRRVGATLAVAISVTITAVLFALLHGDQLGYAWAPLLIIFGVGVILAFVRAH